MNNNKENYIEWNPISTELGKVIVEKVIDDDSGLNIFFRSLKTKRKYKILFDAFVAYRSMDESYRLKTGYKIHEFSQSLYIVDSSIWIEWITDESLEFYKDSKWKHYGVFTEADWIEVISEFEPEFFCLDQTL